MTCPHGNKRRLAGAWAGRYLQCREPYLKEGRTIEAPEQDRGARTQYPERLETPRLLLSRPSEADLPELTEMHTDPRVMATLGGLRPAEELAARHRRYFENWERDGFGLWIARHRPDERFVGRGGLRRVQIGGRDEVEVGYGLAHAFWGQGLATELAHASVRVGFDVLRLEELVCFTLPTNAKSRRVMEKVGFHYERDFEWADLPHVLFRLRRDDWLGRAARDNE